LVLEKWSSGRDIEVVVRHSSGGPLPLTRTMVLSFQSDVLRGTGLAVVWAHLLWNWMFGDANLRKKIMNVGRKSVNVGMKSVNLGRKSVNLGRKSVNLGRKSVNLGRKSVNLGRKSMSLERKIVRKSVNLRRQIVRGNRFHQMRC
jgi:hypothetical protein